MKELQNNQTFRPTLTLLAALLASVLTVACGGGGGGSSSNGPTINGTAATGAAFGGATVTITDSIGTTIPSCGLTDTTTGIYSCTLPAGATAPFVIKASKDDGVGGTEQQFSVVAEVTNGVATAHITPLTTAVVAMLSPTGDPTGFADEMKNDKTKANAAAVNTQVATLQSNLQVLIDGTVGSGERINPMTTPFTAGTSRGMDKLLDAVNVSTTASNPGVTAQVSLALRANPEAEAKFVQGQTTPTSTITPAIVTANQATLKTNPTTLIADLLSRMNTCYALPVSARVAKTDGTGTATDVTDVACKTLFTQDTPSLFKSGGYRVGAKGAFSNLFSSDANGTTYDQGRLEYVINNTDTANGNNTANNGYWLVSYRSKDVEGNVNYGTWALAKEGTDTAPVLKQAGNQYDHDTSVSAIAQSRHFPNQPVSDYLSTGYSLKIINKAGSNGSSIYKEVVVTTPTNKTLTLKPLAGCSYLGLYNGTKTSCTNFVRLSSAYTDPNNTSTTMPSIDTANLFFAPTPWTDAVLAEISNQGKWTFTITLADGSTVVTQKHGTLSRAPTMAELRKQAFAGPTTAQTALLASETSAGYYMVTTDQLLANDGKFDISDAWDVPTGARAPTNVTVFGKSPNNGNSYNDSVKILQTARIAQISCTRQSTADAHCASDVNVNGMGSYAVGTTVREIQLNADTAKGVTLSKHIALYNPTAQ